MKHHRILVFLILTVAFTFAQSPHNSMSYGILLDQVDASSLGYGTAGLIPSSNSSFSTRNPITWTDLKFATLTVHYNSGEVEYLKEKFRSGFGHLSNVAFIVPIKNKFSWGMGVFPLSRKEFSFLDDSVKTVVFSGDTSLMSKQLEGSGGMSSFFTGGSWRIDEKNSLGVQLDFLFGVFNEWTTTFLFNQGATYRRHFQYKGTLLSLFYRSSHFNSQFKSTLYFKVQGPVGQSKTVQTDYFTYVDTEVRPSRDLPLPVTLMAGAVYRFSRYTHLGVEMLKRQFNKNESTGFNSLPGLVGNASRVSVGLLRERVFGSRNFVNLFHYRIGIFQRQHYIFSPEKKLMERGFAFGLGFPFGLTQNQIDIGIRLSKRKSLFSDESELIRQFTVGLTIGDIWLVKRRRR